MDLAERIETAKERLALRALERMYANPFWEERFGARGRRFAEEDGRHHVTYLVTSLWAGSPSTLVNYARWVQTVLTTRGMCTRHLAENFERLAEAIREEGIPGADPAFGYLDEATAALTYADGTARTLQLAAPDLAERAADRVRGSRPEWRERLGETWRDRCRDDLLYLLSYLADGLALDRSDQLVGYVRWMLGFVARRDFPAEYLPELLGALLAELATLPPDERDHASELLEKAVAALETAP